MPLDRARPAAELTRPLPLLALGLLVVNDHWLKGSSLAPAWLTGKLSDFAGLFLFPVLVFAVVRPWARVRRARLATAAAVSTAIVFAVVKLVPGVNAWVNASVANVVLDPTDLMALPMTLAARRWLCRAPGQRARAGTLARAAALFATVLACAATSPPPSSRSYPSWRLEHLGARQVGCARVDAWVSKSGKEGVGITLSARRAASGLCHFEVRNAAVHISGLSWAASRLPPGGELDESDRFFYVPFVFDNEALWNDRLRGGQLELVLVSTGAAAERVVLSMVQSRPSPHWVPPAPEAPEVVEPGARPPLQLADPTIPTDAGGPP
jgi:hypothetical protein